MNYIEDGNSNVEFKCSKTKKNIFLIGDSIRLGYCKTVKNELSDVAEVFYVNENCRNTQFVITNLRKWQKMFDDTTRVEVVQFNCGHWDAAHWNGYEIPLTSTEEYARNIKMIIDLLKLMFVNAKIVFATTTAMNPDGSLGVNPRSNQDIDRYNEIAVKVAKDNDVIINDLNVITRDWGSEKYRDYCHYTADAFVSLGKEVAQKLKEIL